MVFVVAVALGPHHAACSHLPVRIKPLGLPRLDGGKHGDGVMMLSGHSDKATDHPQAFLIEEVPSWTNRQKWRQRI